MKVSTERGWYSLGFYNLDISVAGNLTMFATCVFRKPLAGIVSLEDAGPVFSNINLPLIRNSQMFIIFH